MCKIINWIDKNFFFLTNFYRPNSCFFTKTFLFFSFGQLHLAPILSLALPGSPLAMTMDLYYTRKGRVWQWILFGKTLFGELHLVKLHLAKLCFAWIVPIFSFFIGETFYLTKLHSANFIWQTSLAQTSFAESSFGVESQVLYWLWKWI